MNSRRPEWIPLKIPILESVLVLVLIGCLFGVMDCRFRLCGFRLRLSCMCTALGGVLTIKVLGP